MKRRYICLLSITLLLAGFDQQQAAAESFSTTYLRAQRDNIIRNWQNKVSDDPRCASFKARFKAAGERHNAVNGAFMNDMMKIMGRRKSGVLSVFALIQGNTESE